MEQGRFDEAMARNQSKINIVWPRRCLSQDCVDWQGPMSPLIQSIDRQDLRVREPVHPVRHPPAEQGGRWAQITNRNAGKLEKGIATNTAVIGEN